MSYTDQWRDQGSENGGGALSGEVSDEQNKVVIEFFAHSSSILLNHATSPTQKKISYVLRKFHERAQPEYYGPSATPLTLIAKALVQLITIDGKSICMASRIYLFKNPIFSLHVLSSKCRIGLAPLTCNGREPSLFSRRRTTSSRSPEPPAADTD